VLSPLEQDVDVSQSNERVHDRSPLCTQSELRLQSVLSPLNSRRAAMRARQPSKFDASSFILGIYPTKKPLRGAAAFVERRFRF
jgi:hypothetical protein